MKYVQVFSTLLKRLKDTNISSRLLGLWRQKPLPRLPNLQSFILMGNSLVSRATIFTIITCTVPVLCVGWYAINETTSSLTQAAVDKNAKVAERVASDIGSYVLSKKNFLMAANSKDDIRAMEPQNAKKYLQQLQPFYGSSDSLFIADIQGNQICRTDNSPLVNVKDRDYFNLAIQGTTNFSDPVLSKVNNQLTIIGAAPVYGANNKVVGLLGANLSLTSIQNVIEQILSQNPGYMVTLVDKNLIPLYHQIDSSSVAKRSPLSDDVYSQAVKNRTGHMTATLRGQEFLVSYRPVENTDWVILAHFPKAVALEAAEYMRDSMIKVAFAFIIVFVICGLFVTRKTLAPLRELESGARLVAAGDLTVTLAAHRSDELGNVAKAFNAMTSSLREIVQAVKHSSTKIIASATDIASSAEQSSIASQQVARSMQTSADKVTQQCQETAKTETLLNELLTTSTTVSSTSHQVAAATHECASIAVQGQSIVNQTVEQIKSLNTMLENTVANVTSLGSKANEINRITDIIITITKQTNLLALNAAIEAARAGEAGRGFAVVAGEVKKLAEESANAVKNITTIIGELQAQTNDTISGVRQSFVYTEHSSKTASDLGASFIRIVDAIAHAQQQADNITCETEHQVKLYNQALAAVASITVAAGQNSEAINEIAAVSQEQSAATEEIACAIDQFKALAHSLEHMVQRFRV